MRISWNVIDNLISMIVECMLLQIWLSSSTISILSESHTLDPSSMRQHLINCLEMKSLHTIYIRTTERQWRGEHCHTDYHTHWTSCPIPNKFYTKYLSFRSPISGPISAPFITSSVSVHTKEIHSICYKKGRKIKKTKRESLIYDENRPCMHQQSLLAYFMNCMSSL